MIDDCISSKYHIVRAMDVWGQVVRLTHLHCSHFNMRAFKSLIVSGRKVYEQLDDRRRIFLKQIVACHSLCLSRNFLTKCDNKSGYDHILLTASSQRSFGMQLGGWWLINNILQFGWKESTFIYHSTGLVVSSFTQDLSILSSLYIKERLNGKFSTCKEPWSLPFSQ